MVILMYLILLVVLEILAYPDLKRCKSEYAKIAEKDIWVSHITILETRTVCSYGDGTHMVPGYSSYGALLLILLGMCEGKRPSRYHKLNIILRSSTIATCGHRLFMTINCYRKLFY